MNEGSIVPQLVSEVAAALPSDVDVRTAGGNTDITTPEVVIDWNTRRIPDGNGHNTVGGIITDADGDAIGIEHHTYWEMSADCIARATSEADRDQYLDTIQSAFIPYETTPEAFDPDTRSWDIGASGARENAAIEPDWYEAGVLLSFEYLKRVDETGKDTIETTDTNVTVDQSLDTTSTETN